jgi:hypothetical protein
MRKTLGSAVFGAVLLFGCRVDPMTSEEAQSNLDESSVDSQAAALTSASVQVSTDFTIGDAVQKAADHVRKFVNSQLPCADVSLDNATLTIQYGALPGNCTFHGHKFEGTQTITIEQNDPDEVLVKHTWKDFSNGRVSVTGHAEVTWNLKDPSRHIMHELTWTRLRDGRTGTGMGDRTETPLSGGVAEGIEINGSRSWTGKKGKWSLDIDHVQMRWVDPMPQSGSLVLTTPKDKMVTFTFERIDADTIGVTATGGQRNILLKVDKLGLISRR